MDNNFFETLVVPLPEDIEKLEWREDFDKAVRRIDNRLERDIPQASRKHLMIEQKILKRVPGQYPYTWSEAPDMLRDNVRDFENSEFETLWEEDAMDWIYMDGRARFWSGFLKSTLKTRKEYESRALDWELIRSKTENFGLSNRITASMKGQGSVGCRSCIRGTLGIQEEAERGGEDVKVYLPLLIKYAQIKGARIHSVRIGERETERQEYTIARVDAFQRTICFHTKYRRGQKHSVEFSFESREVYLDFSHVDLEHSREKHDGEKQGANGLAEPTDVWLVQQQPHTRSTPLIRELAAEIVGKEQDPLKKARRIYDYITTHVMYSFMRSYFALTNISQYAASSMKGDYSVQTLLFITLCRETGIPARWQAGLYTSPFKVNCHDWTQFYTNAHGWRCVGCSFGGAAYQEGDTRRWDSYFEDLSPFRLSVTGELGYEFEPPVTHLRNDPYDNQMEETGYGDRSLPEEEYSAGYEMTSPENITY